MRRKRQVKKTTAKYSPRRYGRPRKTRRYQTGKSKTRPKKRLDFSLDQEARRGEYSENLRKSP